MRKEIINIEVKGTKDGSKKVGKLNNSIKDTQKETKKASNEAKQLGSGLDRVTGGAVTKFKGMTNAIKSVNTGFKLMKVAIIGTGIGALLIAIVSLQKAFTSSEAGQNKFAKMMGIIGSVTGNLVDILANLGEKLIWVFENPKKAIKDFSKLIKENITNRFEGILEYIPQMSSAINKLFKGDFSGASETATNAIGKVVFGTDNLTESIKNAGKELNKFGKEIKEDAKKAGEIADKRAKADKIERKLITERAEADRNIADLRFKAEQRDKFTVTERIAFLKEASKISEDIANKEIEANNLRLTAKIEENKLSKSTKEDLDAVANLKDKSIQLDTSKLTLQKRLQTSLTTFQNEEKAGLKAINDAKQKTANEQKAKDEATENARLKSLDKIQEDYKVKKEEKEAVTELQKIELQQARALGELERLNATEEQKATIIAYWDNQIKEQKATDADEEKKRKDENDATELATEEALQKRKMAIVSQTLGAVSELLGKNTAAGKAAAIAQATMNTYQGITQVWKSESVLPEPFATASKIASTATVLASGLSAVKSIKSQKLPAGASGGSISSASAPQLPQSPSFNIVGANVDNQLETAVGKQTQEPVKAYVVSSDVTTSQEMDRNIIEGASF